MANDDEEALEALAQWVPARIEWSDLQEVYGTGPYDVLCWTGNPADPKSVGVYVPAAELAVRLFPR